MASRFTPSGAVVAALVLFTLINPVASWDTLAFLGIAFILLQKIFGERMILVLLALRPMMDYWRDVVIVSYEHTSININAGLAALLLAWSVYFFVKNSEYWKKIPLKWPWFAFLAWCALSFLWTHDATATITETVKAANLFALFGIGFVLRAKEGEKFSHTLYSVLIVAALCPLLLAAWQFITHTGMNIDGTPNRIYGTFAHPNILATFALLGFVALTDYYIKMRHHFAGLTWVYTFAYAILLLTIAFTYTRIAYLGLALFLFVIGIKYYPRALKIFVGAIAAFYLLFYPFNNFLIHNFDTNLQANPLVARLTMRSAEADSIQWRTDVARKVFPLFLRHPIIGYGYGAFAKVWDENKGLANLWDNTSEAHNDYLKVAFEGGVIGLALFLAVFAALGLKQIKFGSEKHWINLVFIASIAVYLLLGLSDNMLHHTPVIWWFWALWGVWAAEYS